MSGSGTEVVGSGGGVRGAYPETMRTSIGVAESRWTSRCGKAMTMPPARKRASMAKRRSLSKRRRALRESIFSQTCSSKPRGDVGVVRFAHHGAERTDLLHRAEGVADLDEIPHLHRLLDHQQQTADEVVDDVLGAEADADGKRPKARVPGAWPRAA